MAGVLEHVNLTVTDPEKTAEMYEVVFGWVIRWAVDSELDGRTVHVGAPENGESYLALYTESECAPLGGSSYRTIGGLNHIAVLVDDLDAVEQRVIGVGYATHSHGDYHPGRRFYFHDADNIEYEVVSYAG